ncbi:DNA topology modulation protein [Halobacillus salinus]|uniref:DNA topology modulation protein n=1 Tax=Halobacillus salinus TaxID=192814 RepID=UPI0009A903FB|nr:DNA topology modulation protein [Halobacillus salinus]
MRRIAIVGSGGSGKSTFARKLSNQINIDLYHLDSLLWLPGWVPVTKEQQVAIQQRIVKEDTWIVDGNYNSTLDIRLNEADTIIFLDISRFVCLYRILKRYVVNHNRDREDMAGGCPEQLSWQFLKWIFHYPKNKRPHLLKKLQVHSLNKEVIILKSRRDVERFLRQRFLTT